MCPPSSLQGWTPLEEGATVSLPTMLRGTLTVEQPADTYLDMRNFTKGVSVLITKRLSLGSSLPS